jgi:alternative ribosome-rescue factor
LGYYGTAVKKRRTNKAKRLVAQPRFASRVEKPRKGKGAYRRKARRTGGGEVDD